MPDNLKTLGCRMRPELHKKIRLLSIRLQTSMRRVYTSAFERFLEVLDKGESPYLPQPPADDTKTVSLTVPLELAEALQAQARKDGQNLTDAYYSAISTYMQIREAAGDIPTRKTLGLPLQQAG